jgi:hypothetical protein
MRQKPRGLCQRAKAPDVFVNAAKLIPWNDVRGEEDFRAKNALLSLDFVDREKHAFVERRKLILLVDFRRKRVAFSRKTDQGRWNS